MAAASSSTAAAAATSARASQRVATMWVMPVQTFLELSDEELMQRHQEHRRAGRLERYEGEGESVAFVSHQWLSQTHPDPNLVQLHTLKTIISRVSTGALPKIQGRIEARLETGRDEFVESEELQAWIQSGYLWLDFYSIPQIVQSSQHGHGDRRRGESELADIPEERKVEEEGGGGGGGGEGGGGGGGGGGEGGGGEGGGGREGAAEGGAEVGAEDEGEGGGNSVGGDANKDADHETDGRFARANSSKLDEVEELQLAIKSIPDFIEACAYL